MSSGPKATSDPVCVGLVDTGLGSELDTSVRQALIATRGFVWDGEKEAVAETKALNDTLGHGSALAATVAATAPGVKLLMAQVFFQQWQTRPAQVAAAIDWLCASGARVINLSLGLRSDRPVLRQACDHALAAGVILVASTPAQGEAVFPAAYNGVIRATGDARCDRGQISWLDTPQADVGGCVAAACGPVAGASVGAAYASAHIARYLQSDSGAGLARVMEHLRQRADYTGRERRGAP